MTPRSLRYFVIVPVIVATVLVVSRARWFGTDTIAESARATDARLAALSSYANEDWGKAEASLAHVIAAYRDSPDPKVQDQVGMARLQMGYAAAHQGSYSKARTYFKTAEHEYRGTGYRAPDFGGIDDQAAYQAAVCLDASGNKTEAETEYLAFFVRYQLSPLVKAAHRRLVKLNPAQSAKYDALFQKALDAQAEKARSDMVSCGPKALSRLLIILGHADPGYEVLAKECETDKTGTTLKGLKSALLKHGISAFGYELNRSDFGTIPTPAIWLAGEHYLIIEGIAADAATVYDPSLLKTREVKLPAASDSTFLATILTLRPMTIEGKS